EAGAAGAVHGTIDGFAHDHLHGIPGSAADDPQHVQDRRRAHVNGFHVAARSIAAQGLSIFGDHQDVMAVRQTGWALLASASVQEAQDLALVAHAATLRARVPFLHFFDGFRTSHEVTKIQRLTEADLLAMIDEDLVRAHRRRGLTPDRPTMRGTAQNPDVYFQAREASNAYYRDCPDIVQAAMERFAEHVGRTYHLFD